MAATQREKREAYMRGRREALQDAGIPYQEHGIKLDGQSAYPLKKVTRTRVAVINGEYGPCAYQVCGGNVMANGGEDDSGLWHASAAFRIGKFGGLDFASPHANTYVRNGAAQIIDLLLNPTETVAVDD